MIKPINTKTVPTFLLKGINSAEVANLYLSGYYNRKPIEKAKIKTSKCVAVLAPKYSDSNDDRIYQIKNRNNSNIIIATTNQENYEVFTKTGQVKMGGQCDYCHTNYDHANIGYPVAHTESRILVGDVYKIVYSFWVDGEFCCFEHALTYVQDRLKSHREEKLKTSENLLRLLHKLMHPNADILKPVKDIRLLKSKALTKEEYDDPRHIYIQTDRVLTIPVKVDYVQQHFSEIKDLTNVIICEDEI